MDWLTFTVEMSKALGWPIATLVIFLVFKHPLLELLALIRKIKYKDIEVEIAKKEIVEIRELSASAVSGKIGEFPIGDLQYFKQLADISPRAAITEAWSRVERLIYHAAKVPGMESRPAGVSFSKILASLRESGAVEPSMLSVVEKLRAIRNKVVHFQSEALSAEDAMDYVLSMNFVEAGLRVLGLVDDESNFVDASSPQGGSHSSPYTVDKL